MHPLNSAWFTFDEAKRGSLVEGVAARVVWSIGDMDINRFRYVVKYGWNGSPGGRTRSML
jgi:hypothetical protein